MPSFIILIQFQVKIDASELKKLNIVPKRVGKEENLILINE